MADTSCRGSGDARNPHGCSARGRAGSAVSGRSISVRRMRETPSRASGPNNDWGRAEPQCHRRARAGSFGRWRQPSTIGLVQPGCVSRQAAARRAEILLLCCQPLVVDCYACSRASLICARTAVGLLALSCRSRQNGLSPTDSRRDWTTSRAARFSATNRTRLPSATARVSKLVIVWDFPVPGGPSRTKVRPAHASRMASSCEASAGIGQAASSSSRSGSSGVGTESSNGSVGLSTSAEPARCASGSPSSRQGLSKGETLRTAARLGQPLPRPGRQTLLGDSASHRIECGIEVDAVLVLDRILQPGTLRFWSWRSFSSRQ